MSTDTDTKWVVARTRPCIEMNEFIGKIARVKTSNKNNRTSKLEHPSMYNNFEDLIHGIVSGGSMFGGDVEVKENSNFVITDFVYLVYGSTTSGVTVLTNGSSKFWCVLGQISIEGMIPPARKKILSYFLLEFFDIITT